ncbi:MAG: sulfurtransferase [Chloroflexi bacterium]|nr:sulfurtransferase [Chloroflexota bacterium]
MTLPNLVSTDWLAARLNDPGIRIADVRWYLFEKDKTGRGEYARGHIPGAIYLDIDADLASPRGVGPGRHPLPRAEQFADALARAGIGAHTDVVCYDDRGGATAARLWWLLRYFGHDAVSLLDGGIATWIAEGRALQTDAPTFPRAIFVPRARREMLADRHAVEAMRNDPRAVILDSRVAERYAGKIEPIDPRAGHIPGAVNAPLAGNLRAPDDLRFRDALELRARFASLGANDAKQIVAYCGSGVNACQNIFALELAGFAPAQLYEGSWSDWSSLDLPTATGENP